MTRTSLSNGVRAVLGMMLLSVAPIAAIAQTGQTIADGVRSAPDGTVRFTFRARPDVCGSGNAVYVGEGASGRSRNTSPDVEWDADCGHGPVRVVLDVRDHAVTGLRSYVGGRWRAASGVTDLGNFAPQVGASYLVSLAKEAPEAVAHKAIFPATLGDSVVIWPQLMQIARGAALPSQTRRDAIFWLGQMAGETATANLAQIVTEDTVDRAVRESAVFALSQQPKEEGIPALIHVAQSNRDPSVRKKALFWLGQSNDPRALALFESILAGNGKSKVQ
ncbi:MAG TPA: HEAT repeat domain-containing protein [Gemmatimonadaceae bacterium]